MGVPTINLAETSDFDLGGLRVSPARRQVSMNGQSRELEPKVAQVLVALASATPSVVSRDRLIDQCWGGRIVGDDALNRCILALRHLAKEFSPEPFAIETVPRVGYSLLAGPVGAMTGPRAFRPRIVIALLLVAIVAIAFAFIWTRYQRAHAAPATIAVLPFRNLSAGDPYFAQGIGEEILGRLAREPDFRVASSTSSVQVAKLGDLREAARKLKVDYVIEGSVRRQGERVRVDAGLIRASDGIRLWSATFNGSLDDVFSIQGAIGKAVADGLKRKLVHSSPLGAKPANGNAYALYLNARGLLRSGNPQGGQDAVALLQEAVRADPKFAPAWASLGEALILDGRTKSIEEMISIIPRANLAVRRALELDPSLADAHAVLASLIGDDTPQGIAELRRAADLAPRSSEGLMWLAGSRLAAGDYEQSLSAFRQAHDADPLWPNPVRSIVDVAGAIGDRRAAENAIATGFSDDPVVRNFALARVAWFFGDYSDAARRWAELSKGASRWAAPSRTSLQDALFTLELLKERPVRPPSASLAHSRYPPRLWEPPPTAAEWRNRNRSTTAALVYQDVNIVAAKQMLVNGRAQELVATYDSPTGLLGMKQGTSPGACYIQPAGLVALALREVGRGREADQMLARSDAVLRKLYSQGKVAGWLENDAAAIWALQGKTDMAVDALDRALRRGWANAGRTDLRRLENEPALRALRGNPRFEAVRLKYDAHYARERVETARALKA
jgi:TolB-like protein/DNA-binding winged helix-turn-helix (wHTH) protein